MFGQKIQSISNSQILQSFKYQRILSNELYIEYSNGLKRILCFREEGIFKSILIPELISFDNIELIAEVTGLTSDKNYENLFFQIVKTQIDVNPPEATKENVLTKYLQLKKINEQLCLSNNISYDVLLSEALDGKVFSKDNNFVLPLSLKGEISNFYLFNSSSKQLYNNQEGIWYTQIKGDCHSAFIISDHTYLLKHIQDYSPHLFSFFLLPPKIEGNTLLEIQKFLIEKKIFQFMIDVEDKHSVFSLFKLTSVLINHKSSDNFYIYNIDKLVYFEIKSSSPDPIIFFSNFFTSIDNAVKELMKPGADVENEEVHNNYKKIVLCDYNPNKKLKHIRKFQVPFYSESLMSVLKQVIKFYDIELSVDFISNTVISK